MGGGYNVFYKWPNPSGVNVKILQSYSTHFELIILKLLRINLYPQTKTIGEEDDEKSRRSLYLLIQFCVGLFPMNVCGSHLITNGEIIIGSFYI